jgi:hypothetical protein
MAQAEKKCMVCAKAVPLSKGGICEPCQEKIRREAMGEQARVSEGADRELIRHGVTPAKSSR